MCRGSDLKLIIPYLVICDEALLLTSDRLQVDVFVFFLDEFFCVCVEQDRGWREGGRGEEAGVENDVDADHYIYISSQIQQTRKKLIIMLKTNPPPLLHSPFPPVRQLLKRRKQKGWKEEWWDFI